MKKEIKEMTEVMLAYNGEYGVASNIQYREDENDEWTNLTPSWNWSRNDYRIDPSTIVENPLPPVPEYAEVLRRQYIENAWNGKSGLECNIEFASIGASEEEFESFKADAPSWSWEFLDYRIKSLKV